MRKNEYDLFVDDQISSKKYQVTLKCKYYTKVSQLKKYLHKFIKSNFDIIHNDITLLESMIVDQIFSLHCQNIITICRKTDPMIEILVNHKLQYNKQLKQQIIQNELLPHEECAKTEDMQSELDTSSTTISRKCVPCEIQNKMISHYESSILNLIEENEQLQQQLKQLQNDKRKLNQKECIKVNHTRKQKRS